MVHFCGKIAIFSRDDIDNVNKSRWTTGRRPFRPKVPTAPRAFAVAAAWLFIVVPSWCASAQETQITPAVELQTVDGKRIDGVLERLDADGCALKDGDTSSTVPLPEIESLTFRNPASLADETADRRFVLVDGSTLRGRIAAAEEESVRVRLVCGIELDCRLETIRWIAQPADASLEERWQQLVADNSDGDRLALPKGTVLNYFDGVVQGIGLEAIQFRFQGEDITVPWERIYGLALHVSGAISQKRAVHVHLCDDSILTADTVAWEAENGKFIIVRGDTRLAIRSDLVRALKFKSATGTSLLELKPVTVSYEPFIGTPELAAIARRIREPRFVEAVKSSSDSVHLDGEECDEAVVLHARSRVGYRLDRLYSQLVFRCGIEDRFRNSGNAVVRIVGDGKVLWESQISGKDSPLQVEVDLQNTRELVLEVDFGENGDLGDVVVIARPRLLE